VGALEAGRVGQRDRPGARAGTRHHQLHDPAARRRGSLRAAPKPPGADASGAGGDLARRRCWGVGERDCRPSGPSALDDHTRAQPPSGPTPLPRCRGRPARLGACEATATLQTGPPAGSGQDRRREVAGGLVAGADCRLAEDRVSRRRDYAGVARDDLPDPVHPGARGVEAGARRTPAAHARSVGPGRRAASTAARDKSSMRSRSGNGRPRQPTGRSPATGKATCSPAPPTATSRHSSSGALAS
jgi:hypothetical protein